MKLTTPPRAAPAQAAAPSRVRAAFEAVMAFAPSYPALLYIPAQRLQEIADEEASFGEIAVDERGLTAGTRLHVVQPGRALLARWREARGPFDTAIAPKMADIQAIERLDAEIAARRMRRDAEVQQAEQIWEAQRRNRTIRERWQEAEGVFRRERLAHGQRDATMRAYSLAYWLAMLCIGVAEWLINYDTFFLFVGVPAIAAGATVVLGVVLAFSAHGHGELLKQWSYRFGQHQTRMSRVSGYRLLGLSTLGLLIVLAAAGGSRYAAAVRALAGQPGENILGSQVVVEVSPLRDVLISLLANLGAWVVGVFLAYFSHDPDPEFMDATRQHRKASRAFFRARRGVDDQIKTFEGGFEKDVSGMQRAAAARAGEVAADRAMLDQVNKREEGVAEAIASAVHGHAERYRDVLAQVAVTRRREVGFVRRVGDKSVPLTPYDYKAADLLVDAELLRAASPGPAWAGR